MKKIGETVAFFTIFMRYALGKKIILLNERWKETVSIEFLLHSSSLNDDSVVPVALGPSCRILVGGMCLKYNPINATSVCCFLIPNVSGLHMWVSYRKAMGFRNIVSEVLCVDKYTFTKELARVCVFVSVCVCMWKFCGVLRNGRKLSEWREN